MAYLKRPRAPMYSKFIASALLAGMGSAVPAWAQEQNGSQDAVVKDIIVTAQRVGESLQRVPLSVVAVPTEQLANLKVNTLGQVTVAVPSLTVGANDYYSVRGVGAFSALSRNLDSSVGIAFDEVSLGVPTFMSFGILDDVAQVEVLTGPQGLLFGRNASAGLINVVSKKPVIGESSGEVSGELDDRDTAAGGHFGLIARANVNIPVSTNSALRVNISEFRQDPIVKYVGGPMGQVPKHDQRFGGRIKYLWHPGDRLSVYLIGDYNDVNGFPSQTSYRTDMNGPAPFGINAHLNLLADGITAGPNNLLYGSDGPVFRHLDSGGVSLNIAYELSHGVTLSNIAAWRGYALHENTDLDYGRLNIINFFEIRDAYRQLSDELRLAFKTGAVVDGQAGLYAFDQRTHHQEQNPAAALTPDPKYAGSDLDTTLKTRSLAAYGQLNVHPIKKLTLLGGARVTNDHVSVDSLQNAAGYVLNAFGPVDARNVRSFDHTNVSYKVGAQYQFSPDVMGYATYSTGYKGPSQNIRLAVIGEDTTVRPETVKMVEGGLKTTLLDHHLRLNIAAYLEDFKDLQLQYFDPAINSLRIGSAASARTKGIEVSGTARPFKGLTINFGATLQDAKFTDYPGASCPKALGGCSTFNAAGVALPSAAKFISTLQAGYEFGVGGQTNAFLQGDFYHRSPINFSANGDPGTRFGTVNTLGLSTGLRFHNHAELSIFCRDCNNQRIPDAIYPDSVDSFLTPVSSYIQDLGYNSVRTIGLAGSFKF